MREQVAAEIEAEANARAKRRDEHRDVSIRTRHDDAEAASMHMETAQAFRSEAIGLYDAARIARGEKGGE